LDRAADEGFRYGIAYHVLLAIRFFGQVERRLSETMIGLASKLRIRYRGQNKQLSISSKQEKPEGFL
jgi:hypothetical protein